MCFGRGVIIGGGVALLLLFLFFEIGGIVGVLDIVFIFCIVEES